MSFENKQNGGMIIAKARENIPRTTLMHNPRRTISISWPIRFDYRRRTNVQNRFSTN